jgi:hypothetical protein
VLTFTSSHVHPTSTHTHQHQQHIPDSTSANSRFPTSIHNPAHTDQVRFPTLAQNDNFLTHLQHGSQERTLRAREAAHGPRLALLQREAKGTHTHIPNTTTPRRHQLTQNLQVDYKKLAGLAGFTNPASASNAWAKIQKKIAAQASNSPDSTTPEAGTPKTPKATPAKKRGAKAAADGETPVKKAKTPKKVVKEEPIEEDDEVVSAGDDGEGGNMFQL